MIDPRSREALEHPFPGVDGEQVLVGGPGPHAGSVGVVLHQVGHDLLGVICRVRITPGAETADIPASRLIFLGGDGRPRDLRGALSRPRAHPNPRYLAVPTTWGVYDRRTSRVIAGQTDLTFDAADLIAAGLNGGEIDVPEDAQAG